MRRNDVWTHVGIAIFAVCLTLPLVLRHVAMRGMDFNTTLMLVGSDPPLTIMMYGRMREGATPVLNAVSLLLMVASAAIALSLMRKR